MRKNKKTNYPKCPKTMTGEHYFIDIEIDPGEGEELIFTEKCVYCEIIDDRK